MKYTDWTSIASKMESIDRKKMIAALVTLNDWPAFNQEYEWTGYKLLIYILEIAEQKSQRLTEALTKEIREAAEWISDAQKDHADMKARVEDTIRKIQAGKKNTLDGYGNPTFETTVTVNNDPNDGAV